MEVDLALLAKTIGIILIGVVIDILISRRVSHRSDADGEQPPSPWPRRILISVVVLILVVIQGGLQTVKLSPTQSAGQNSVGRFPSLAAGGLDGPARPSLKVEPDKPTFNCLLKDDFLNPQASFFWIRDAEIKSWHSDAIQVADGKLYDFAVYPVNCGRYGEGHRTNWLESVTLELGGTGGNLRTHRIGAVLQASNAATVWSGVELQGAESFSYSLVPGKSGT